MVTNHARKALARKIIAQSEYRVSYSDALIKAAILESARGRSGVADLSRSDREIAALSAELIIEGRDLIIFGGPFWGKSLASYAVLQETELHTLFVADSYWDASVVQSHLHGVPCTVKALPKHGQLALDPAVELLVIDEPQTLRSPDDYGNLLKVDRRMLTIHGHSPSDAQHRLQSILPELELRNPFFLQAEYDWTAGQKSFRLHR